MFRPFACIIAGLLAASPVQAQDDNAAGLQFDHPWARVTNTNTGAAYMTITTRSLEPDRLISATCPLADSVELHTTVMEGSIMRMRPVQGIDVKPGEPASLKPGGLHVMLLGLRQPLKEGMSFPLILTFEKAGARSIEVKVQRDGGANTQGHTQQMAPSAGH